MLPNGLGDVSVNWWAFSEESLAQARRLARNRAVQTIQSTAPEGSERRQGSREPPKPLSLEDELRLVRFYAQKIPELCDLCEAPAEVRWTAVVFYRRFFVMRSPMEFDPLPLMFACVHLACKIEEVREITLDKLLEAADFGADSALKAKVAGLELPLLDGISFCLLVEPKPSTALRMLADELRRSPAKTPLLVLEDTAWQEALVRAESLVTEFGCHSDALLRCPASMAIAASLGTALEECASQSAAGCLQAPAPLAELLTLLEDSLPGEAQRVAMRRQLQEATCAMRQLASEPGITEDAVKEAVKSARRCHRIFERLRELDTEQNETQRKERKRRRNESVTAAQREMLASVRKELLAVNASMQAENGCAM